MFNKIVQYLEDNIDEKIRLVFDTTKDKEKTEDQVFGVVKFTTASLDLQQTEYSSFRDFTISFLPKLEEQASTLEIINKFKGSLHAKEFDIEESPYRFLIMFNGEYSVGQLLTNNGDNYQEINLTGQLLITENLISSNELELSLIFNGERHQFPAVASYTDSLENQLENTLVNANDVKNCSALSSGVNKTFQINFSITRCEAHSKLLSVLSLAEESGEVLELETVWSDIYQSKCKVKVRTFTITLIPNTYGVATVQFIQHKELL